MTEVLQNPEIIIAVDIGWRSANTSIMICKAGSLEIVDYGVLVQKDGQRNAEEYFEEISSAFFKFLSLLKKHMGVASEPTIILAVEDAHYSVNVKVLKMLERTVGLLWGIIRGFFYGAHLPNVHTYLVSVHPMTINKYIKEETGEKQRVCFKREERKALLKKKALKLFVGLSDNEPQDTYDVAMLCYVAKDKWMGLL